MAGFVVVKKTGYFGNILGVILNIVMNLALNDTYSLKLKAKPMV